MESQQEMTLGFALVVRENQTSMRDALMPCSQHFPEIISHRHHTFLTIFGYRVAVVDDVKHFALEINVYPASAASNTGM
jgi:hypothetical protein